MRCRVIVGPVAEQELAMAIDWYGRQRKGLGKAFRIAVREAFQRVRTSPEVHAVIRPPDVRRALVDGFPYAIFYRVAGGNVRVMSVFHMSQGPAIWERTVDEDRAETGES